MAKITFCLDKEQEERDMLRMLLDKTLLQETYKMMWAGSDFSLEQWDDAVQGINSRIQSKRNLIETLKKEKQGSSALFTDTRLAIKTMEESLSEIERMWEEIQPRVDDKIREQIETIIFSCRNFIVKALRKIRKEKEK